MTFLATMLLAVLATAPKPAGHGVRDTTIRVICPTGSAAVPCIVDRWVPDEPLPAHKTPHEAMGEALRDLYSEGLRYDTAVTTITYHSLAQLPTDMRGQEMRWQIDVTYRVDGNEISDTIGFRSYMGQRGSPIIRIEPRYKGYCMVWFLNPDSAITEVRK